MATTPKKRTPKPVPGPAEGAQEAPRAPETPETAQEPVETPETPEEAPEPVEEVVLTPEEKQETTAIAKTIVHARDAEEAVAQFTKEQVALIKRLVAKDATDDELMLFVAVCKGAGLNPFLKQVYYVKRWDSKANNGEGGMVGAIQVGIDGFRSIAEGTGAYAGNDDPTFEGEVESEWTDKQGRPKGKYKHPEKASVIVRKVVQGVAYPFTATARWSEFYPGDAQGFMWRKMPYVMLGKCAEGQALRKAFPKQLSGLYTPEEMDQAGPARAALPEDPYQRSKVIIAKSTNADGLEAMVGVIKTSTKYTEDQKETLCLAIHDRVAELRGEGKDAPPPAEAEIT